MLSLIYFNKTAGVGDCNVHFKTQDKIYILKDIKLMLMPQLLVLSL